MIDAHKQSNKMLVIPSFLSKFMLNIKVQNYKKIII